MSKELLKKYIAAYEDYAGDLNKDDTVRNAIVKEVNCFKRMIYKDKAA